MNVFNQSNPRDPGSPRSRRTRTTVLQMCERTTPGADGAAATRQLIEMVCRTSIAPYFRNMSATALTPADVNNWLAWLSTDRRQRPATVRMHARILAAATSRAVREGWLAVDPCRAVELPGLRSNAHGNAAGHSRRLDFTTRIRQALERGDDLHAVRCQHDG